MSLPLDLYDYFDYREFLRDYYLARKARERGFSYRQFAMKAGYNSSGLYSGIVQGKVNLTENTLPKFIGGMKMTPEEGEYFSLMVDYTHAVSAEARQDIFEKMLPMMPSKVRRVRYNQRKYYSEWYYTAVHQSLSVLEIKADYQELVDFINPEVTLEQVQDAMELLQELEMIEEDAQGCWRSRHGAVLGGNEVGPDWVHGFQREMMDLGKESLSRWDKALRNVSTTTFSVSADGHERIRLKLEKTQREIMDIVRSDSREERIYQLNMQYFPISNRRNVIFKDDKSE